MLSEASHRKTNNVWYHSYEIPKTGKFGESKSGMVVARDQGERGMGSYRHKFQLNRMNKLYSLLYMYL